MSRVKDYLAAVRRTSSVVDVPGTPRTLRLDEVAASGGGAVRLRWSFVDPEVLRGDPRPHGRRIRGDLTVRAEGSPEQAARRWWGEVQLAAGHRYALQVDADWVPGQPYVRTVWTRDGAWEALLAHLRRSWDDVSVDADGVIRVDDDREEVVYRIDPDEWAEYLTDPVTTEPSGDSAIVPVAVPMQDGLPLWAVDALEEAAGAWGPVVGLVDGRIVGLPAPEQPRRLRSADPDDG